MEKYMSIMVNKNIVFLDSMQFLNASLNTLAGNLEDKDLKYLKKEFPGFDLKILKGKDIYPYEWMDSIKKSKHAELLPKKAFYSSLNANQRGKGIRHITDKEYEHAQNIWKLFKFKTFKDYHDHYLKQDVVLLADVFESLVCSSIENFKLGLNHYFSAPGLTLDAMLKMTKVKLEKFPTQISTYLSKEL